MHEVGKRRKVKSVLLESFLRIKKVEAKKLRAVIKEHV